LFVSAPLTAPTSDGMGCMLHRMRHEKAAPSFPETALSWLSAL
jgi:hypothetical protein